MTANAETVPFFRVSTQHKKLLADVFTPVHIYLKIRDQFVNTILLESSDYHGTENSFSYICCDPVARFELNGKKLTQQFPDGSEEVTNLESKKEMLTHLKEFSNRFKMDEQPFSFITNGLFGYFSYNAVTSFEDIELQQDVPETHIPEAVYAVFRFVIVINHFKNELYLFEHQYGDQALPSNTSIQQIETLIRNRNLPSYSFEATGGEESNFTDAEFLNILQKGKDHCFRGDVFQIVLSRRFSTPFKGDEFNVYRSLRSINPSPYLFYFDYGNFKLFGSSPESQIVIKNRKATIYPIAGTFRRTGDDKADAALAQKLYDDPKENAEHVMLVDLARNDLSRNCGVVKVENFKEIQYYSHVIHLVSKVVGELNEGVEPLQIVAETFPAGTLSGAPKYRAMQLINQYEHVARSFYAGSIGFMGFNGDFNQAIMIRTFLSKDNTLFYQAGAGVVAKSSIESELQEVHNKLMALRKAIEMAQQL